MEQQTDLSSAATVGSPRHSIRRSSRLQNGLVNMEPYLAQETTTTTPYLEQVEAPIAIPPRHSIRRTSRLQTEPVNLDPYLAEEMTTPTPYLEQADPPAVSYLDQSPYLDEQQDSVDTAPYLNQQLAPTDQALAPYIDQQVSSVDQTRAAYQEQISNLIVVRYENTIRKFGIDASYEAIKEAIKTVFGIRSNRSFYLEDDEGVIWSIDRNMPAGTYNLNVDKGLTIKICVYDESDVPTGDTEERTFYLDEDFRDFLSRRRWSALREVGGFEDVECLSELVEMGVYQRAGHTRG